MRVGEMNEGGRKWMRKRERMRKEWKGDEWDNLVYLVFEFNRIDCGKDNIRGRMMYIIF